MLDGHRHERSSDEWRETAPPADPKRLVAAIGNAVFQALSQPAFIVSPAGAVVLANARGIALRRRFGPELRAILEECAGRATAVTHRSLRAHPSRIPSEAGYSFVVVECEEATLDDVVRWAAFDWKLTQRQATVLRGILDGLTNKEIANVTGGSWRTVEVHVGAIFAKAGVENRARLIAKALRCPGLEGGIGREPLAIRENT